MAPWLTLAFGRKYKSMSLRHPVRVLIHHVKSLALFAILLSTACSPKPPAESAYETSGTTTERVATITLLISKVAPVPSPLTDAYLVEQQFGDNQLGPADFMSFYALAVASSDLSVWRSALPPLDAADTPPKYAAPKISKTWWLTPGEFATAEFYSPRSLTGRNNGWVAITPKGKIFVYAFTM